MSETGATLEASEGVEVEGSVDLSMEYAALPGAVDGCIQQLLALVLKRCTAEGRALVWPSLRVTEEQQGEVLALQCRARAVSLRR
ncbi:MAG TPA: hypothetical protein VE153_41525 [Myxococcus sp.]|nr:hypothetical protein [Myxococcus sp.]